MLPENAIFHVMWKQATCGNKLLGRITERRLLDDTLAALTSRLPPTWKLASTRGQKIDGGKKRLDAVLTIAAPDGATKTIVVEAKRRVDPKDVLGVMSQLRSHQEHLAESAGLVAAPFLSPTSRRLLSDRGISYADSTGNLRLVLDRPAVFIEAEGANSDPWARDSGRPLRSLKGPTAGRVVRALCDFRPPFGVQQLAERSDTALASVSRVFAVLDADALVVRERRGPVTEVKWADLIRRWTDDYGFSRTNQVRTFIGARGLPALASKLRDTSMRYAVTGSLAAIDLAPLAPPRLGMVYVDDADEAADRLGLRPTESGANVMLAEPFDSVVYDRTRGVDGLRCAAPSQVAADLLTSPGRGPAEGEELLRWMQENEDAWRR